MRRHRLLVHPAGCVHQLCIHCRDHLLWWPWRSLTATSFKQDACMPELFAVSAVTATKALPTLPCRGAWTLPLLPRRLRHPHCHDSLARRVIQ